jgi:hypothetical protein
MAVGRRWLITTFVPVAPAAASAPIRARALLIQRLTWAANRAPTRVSVEAAVLHSRTLVAVAVLHSRTLVAVAVPRNRTSAAVAVLHSRTSAVAAVPRNRAQVAAARKVVADVRPRAMAAMAIDPRVTADGWKLAGRISRRIGPPACGAA